MRREQLSASVRRGPRARWGRRLAVLAALIAAILLLAVFLLTDSAPSAAAQELPTPIQAGAGREAASQLRNGRNGLGGEARIVWRASHLDGLSALATHGLRPDRLNLSAGNEAMRIVASHELPLGRWLNVELTAREGGEGFPSTSMTVGSVPLPPYLTRKFLEAGRLFLRWEGTDLAPLDRLVRDFSVRDGRVVATVDLPARNGIVERLVGLEGRVDPALTLDVYCRLSRAQAAKPESDLAAQVRRAFPAGRSSVATAQSNRAAFIALAMFIVDRRAGYLAQVDDAQAARCAATQSAFLLHGRSDLPSHWALSAALAAGTGEQAAEAIGVWKELADSLARGSRFARGDPSGFSFVDLAADRSGFRVARAAMADDQAADMAGRLSTATPAQILPPALLHAPEGLSDDRFQAAYGGINDPRYTEAVDGIDATLDRQGITRH